MEKLLELLNNPEIEPSSKIEHWTEISVQNCDYLIISKNRGFIQKLIEKDLIDIEKFYSMTQNIEEIWRKINPPKIEVSLDNVKDPLWEFEKQRKKYLAEWLIMFLAIQDEPIRVLISILK